MCKFHYFSCGHSVAVGNDKSFVGFFFSRNEILGVFECSKSWRYNSVVDPIWFLGQCDSLRVGGWWLVVWYFCCALCCFLALIICHHRIQDCWDICRWCCWFPQIPTAFHPSFSLFPVLQLLLGILCGLVVISLWSLVSQLTIYSVTHW